MRKLLVLGAAIVALVSLGTIAQGQTNDHGHVWFFGDCENPYLEPDTITTDSGGGYFFGGGCRGIGIFAGMWDSESIAEHVAYEAMDEFGGYWEVDYLKAINLFGGPPIVGETYGCETHTPVNVTPQGLGGGLWIALFSVEPCEPEICVPPVEDLLAVAYIDNDTGDGGYDPCVDTLIAKLVDADESGTVNDGDRVVTNQYPLNFTATTLGIFGVTEHVLSSVVLGTTNAETIEIAFDGKRFEFHHLSPGSEFYQEDDENTVFTYIQDVVGGADDEILIDTASASAPQTGLPLVIQDDDTDNAFIDVEIYFIAP